mgnify:CR=1 FL=1
MIDEARDVGQCGARLRQKLGVGHVGLEQRRQDRADRAGVDPAVGVAVTVALSPKRSCAIGLPTMFERPTTTAFSPARLPRWSRSIIRQPSGVQGTIDFCPLAKSGGWTGTEG